MDDLREGGGEGGGAFILLYLLVFVKPFRPPSFFLLPSPSSSITLLPIRLLLRDDGDTDAACSGVVLFSQPTKPHTFLTAEMKKYIMYNTAHMNHSSKFCSLHYLGSS